TRKGHGKPSAVPRSLPCVSPACWSGRRRASEERCRSRWRSSPGCRIFTCTRGTSPAPPAATNDSAPRSPPSCSSASSRTTKRCASRAASVRKSNRPRTPTCKSSSSASSAGGPEMADVAALLGDAVSPEHVLTGDEISDDYGHDEALTATPETPAFVVRPGSTAEVSALMRVANEQRIPVTARGSGTGLSGAAVPRAGGMVVSFERMNEIVEIDTSNHVAVVQPGVTLDHLDEATAAHQLVYPVYPGEYSSSLGGNVATNAGGMRAVKYGVTRHQVLGLEAVLANGDMIRTGGRFVKATTGYDLTQLVIGSEGTLA